MAKELERAGVPTVLVTALPGVAMKVGANRVLRGKSFSHPCGDPALDAGAERRFRVSLVRQALAALQTPVEGPTLFETAAPRA
jgi:glycine reductase